MYDRLGVEVAAWPLQWDRTQRASAVTGAAIKIMARVNVKAVSLPMAGYTQARTPASPPVTRPFQPGDMTLTKRVPQRVPGMKMPP